MINTYIQMKKCDTLQEYQNLKKDSNTIYFITDTKQIYVGDTEFLTTTLPDAFTSFLQNHSMIFEKIGFDNQLSVTDIEDQEFIYNSIIFANPSDGNDPYIIIHLIAIDSQRQYKINSSGIYTRVKNIGSTWSLWSNIIREEFVNNKITTYEIADNSITFDKIADDLNFFQIENYDHWDEFIINNYMKLPQYFHVRIKNDDEKLIAGYYACHKLDCVSLTHATRVELINIDTGIVRAWKYMQGSMNLQDITPEQAIIYRQGGYFCSLDSGANINDLPNQYKIPGTLIYTNGKLNIQIGKDAENNPIYKQIKLEES